jgi:crossover junction endodeoxyribonuclease RusA
MGEPVEYFVEGVPVAQPRVKARAIGKQARVYTPDTADKWKAAVKASTRIKLKVRQGRYSLFLNFCLPRPKAHYRTGKNSHLLRDAAPEHHAQKPDVDNLAKAVIDAMVDSGRVDDDCYLTSLTVTKEWSDAVPGVFIRFRLED